MLKGQIKSYNVGTGTGVITPEIHGRDVLFLSAVVEGSGNLNIGRHVKYELYDDNDEPEAKRVVLCRVTRPGKR